jgi:DNA-directed RNA polymerase specialized sigma24 family protein
MSARGREASRDDFDSTCWSAVVAARDRSDPCGRDALDELCRVYWYPLYAYVRRSGHSADDGHDLTQGFFATVVADGFLDEVSPEKGKFRAYLLACCRHYLSDQRRRQRARKRGGGRPGISIDRDEGDRRFREEPWHELTPERLFERAGRWRLSNKPSIG